MMKNALAAFWVLFSVCPAFAYEALVIACHDGDTVRVRRLDAPVKLTENEENDLTDVLKTGRVHMIEPIKNECVEKIRLAGIDAPELAQPFGIESRNFLEQLILGQKVEVEERSLDRYGRKVAELTTTNGIDVNHRLVQIGLAWCYPSFAKKDKELFSLEARARENCVGLWSAPNPEPPWVFRKQMAAQLSQKNL
ncbi:MAG: thermonuclease family protein [Candidatus Obscuribacterales bacterium]|nr:thermonuclease family protein [Candidatus Obscuribacterales bacterium]